MINETEGRVEAGRTWNDDGSTSSRAGFINTLWTTDVDLRPRDGVNVNPTAHKYTVSHRPTKAVSIATSRRINLVPKICKNLVQVFNENLNRF